MSPQLLEIEKQAGRLPVQDREVLAGRLMQSLDNIPLSEVEEAWVQEAERRFAAWKRGERKGIPAASAFKRIRKDLGW